LIDDDDRVAVWIPMTSSKLPSQLNEAINLTAIDVTELPAGIDFLSDDVGNQLYINYSKNEFDSGKNSELIHLFSHLVKSNIPLPSWLVEELASRFQKWSDCEYKTMDEALGIVRKNFRQHASMKKNTLLDIVYDKIEDEKANGAAIDPILFSKVGKRFNISASTARDYYYEIKNILLAEYQQMDKPTKESDDD